MEVNRFCQDIMDRPALGTKRRRFAWRPTRCLSTPTPSIEPLGWRWLQAVVETQTAQERWVAYAADQPDTRLYSNWVVDLLRAFVLMGIFAGAALVTFPITHLWHF